MNNAWTVRPIFKLHVFYYCIKSTNVLAEASTCERDSSLLPLLLPDVFLYLLSVSCAVFQCPLRSAAPLCENKKQIWDFQNCFRQSFVGLQLFDLLSPSSSLSTIFLFWPFPAAPSTSLAICARRIFLKSSCVRSLLPLIAAALAFLSSTGILWSFSAWQESSELLAQRQRNSQPEVCRFSPLLLCLHQKSDGHPPTPHRHRLLHH